MPRLHDKVILVTGSVTGIGEGMARRFAAEGALVIVHGPDADEARRMAGEIGPEETVRWVAGDLADPDVPARLIAGAVVPWGRLDALVNNAAVTTRSNLDTTDADTFDRIIAINLRAPLLLARAALPHFRARHGGKILNIGSTNAYCGENNLLAYSVSKGGLMTLTRNLADALGKEGIRVCQINPGWTLTPNEYALKQREGLPPDWPDRLSPSDAPSGRLLSPDDIAQCAVYLLSDEAPLINGAVIDVAQFPVIGRNPPKNRPES